MQNMSLPFLQLSLLKRAFNVTLKEKVPLISVKSTFSLLFLHKILIPNFKCYCDEGLCMSQHIGAHENSLNLLDEKFWMSHIGRCAELGYLSVSLTSGLRKTF